MLFGYSMHETHWSETNLNEMMTALRVNVFRGVNLLSFSWCSNHYGFHSTKLIKWRFSMSHNV
jgi:hypothetical protein